MNYLEISSLKSQLWYDKDGILFKFYLNENTASFESATLSTIMLAKKMKAFLIHIHFVIHLLLQIIHNAMQSKD